MAFTPLLTKLRGQRLSAGGQPSAQVIAASGGLCSQGARDGGPHGFYVTSPGDKARHEDRSCGRRGGRDDAEPRVGKVLLMHAVGNSACSISLEPRIE